MHFLGGFVVVAPKINLRFTEDELAMRTLFDRYFNPSPKILLSNSGFQNLLDEIEKNPSTKTLKKREEIRKYILWS